VSGEVSNDWKIAVKKFQRLEKCAEKVPTIGKTLFFSSNDWKTGWGLTIYEKDDSGDGFLGFDWF
jgi:hypothetical protein